MELMTESELETYKLHRRFDRMGRLIGDAQMKKLMDAHVMVIGLGGVGSWAAESLARSGIGRLTLVDFDDVCITNFNRQLHAVGGAVGEKKAVVMAERMKKINPQLQVEGLVQFYDKRFVNEVFGENLSRRPDYVIDAIDSVTAKCHLINLCKTNGIPIICAMGTGGRMDPTRLRVVDLAETDRDPLARNVRSILRAQYDFPSDDTRGNAKKTTMKFGIPAIVSDEPVREPVELVYDGGKGFRCVCPQGQNEFFNCDSRNLILGNSSFVTGSAGFLASSLVVRALLGEWQPEPGFTPAAQVTQ